MEERNKELRKIIREILKKEYSYLIEGIDIDKFTKTISFNSSHEKNVNTSIQLNPTFNSVDGYPVISIFKRKRSKENNFDGNPLIYALKGINGWKFENPKEDIINLLKQFVRISEKIKPEYDTIITIPSSNELNINFLHRLNKIIRAKYQIKDWLFKLDADFVYENFIDWGKLKKDFPGEYKILSNQLNKSFRDMEEKNKNMFSFKHIQTADLRKYITKTMDIHEEKTIEYAHYINDKDILILDDTIASGTTISEACRIIMKTYAPKSMTIITLFSKL